MDQSRPEPSSPVQVQSNPSRYPGLGYTFPVISPRLPVCGPVQSDLPIRPDWTEPYRGPGSSGLVESLAVVQLLINKCADVNATNKDGQTPLHFAVFNGQEEVARLLVDKGADLEATDKYGQTPLLLALMYEEEVMARLLTDKGANAAPSTSDENRWTQLDIAAENGHEAVFQLLLPSGINAANGNGWTPLHDVF